MNALDVIEKQIDEKLEAVKLATIAAVEIGIAERAIKAELQWLMTANPDKREKYQAGLDALA